MDNEAVVDGYLLMKESDGVDADWSSLGKGLANSVTGNIGTALKNISSKPIKNILGGIDSGINTATDYAGSKITRLTQPAITNAQQSIKDTVGEVKQDVMKSVEDAPAQMFGNFMKSHGKGILGGGASLMGLAALFMAMSSKPQAVQQAYAPTMQRLRTQVYR